VATVMVGRGAELARLLSLVERAAAERRPQAATVLADAGVGKSRLLHELQQALAAHDQPPAALLARALPASLLQPSACCATCWRAGCTSPTATAQQRHVTS
jgi:AAA ATPase domain